MDPQNDPNANQEAQNENEQQRNVVNEIHEGLNTLRDLRFQLRLAREHACLSLASYL